MDELIKEIESRRARRALSATPVPREVTERIIRAAIYAPSCANNQSWRFVVVDGDVALEKVRDGLTGGNYWARESPLVVLVCTRADLDCQLSDNRNYALFDAGLATENLILQAFKEGLVAHPIAGFRPTEIKTAFEIPEDYTLITLVIIGYPGEESHLSEKHLEQEHGERVRKPEEEVVSFNRWFKTGFTP
ncbi:MAG TPA: nitroreductase family protein [Spirochaetia bacterium]|nr:nitroreductase family protein [Spirochaetia bacterium]